MMSKKESLRKDARKVGRALCCKRCRTRLTPPQISDTLSDLDDTVSRKESKLVDARSAVAAQQQKLESDHLKVARLRKRLSRYFVERKQAQDRAISAHSAALTDKTRIAAIVDRLNVLSKEHDRLSDSRDRVKDLVDSLSDKVGDAKGKAEDLQEKIQDVKCVRHCRFPQCKNVTFWARYEEHDKLEAARIGFT
jgi:chromosome segregation ATPase